MPDQETPDESADFVFPVAPVDPQNYKDIIEAARDGDEVKRLTEEFRRDSDDHR